MSSPPKKTTENQDSKGKSVNEAEPQEAAEPASPEPQTPSEAQVPETDLPQMPETPMTEAPEPRSPPTAPPEPLTEREKYLVSLATQQVLNQIDPLLIKLQQISNEAVSMGAQQKLQELERGINERIANRVNKINAIIGRRGR
ncbi:hypothetical protein [Thalassovita aquimarina]|uniref:Uncharacterized protein n=1 Tax=Thalassovita aquimarina TaxID=2785917 RepID=A0ABS5HWQ2_9RHOB|nr:hypothetical protein [Thalassovita aquimarina]MBR9653430.1 hypothetical protein [Thalassovita aquimarina]